MPYSSYCPGFDFSVLLHRGFLGAANEAVLNNVMKKKIKKEIATLKRIEENKYYLLHLFLQIFFQNPYFLF
jgi:hypothetical protein